MSEEAVLPGSTDVQSFAPRELKLKDGRTVHLRTATEDDMDDIRQLYYAAYGGRYTLSEINDRSKMKWCLNDPNYLWLLNRHEGKAVSSVLFVVDPKNRLGKTFAGVVHPEYRGQKMTVNTIRMGRDYLISERQSCDLMYAVVRTFVSPTFHQDLNSLGFVDQGVLPNVRKLKSYETHGLKIYFTAGALQSRRREPHLTPHANMIYSIVRSQLGLEEAVVEDVPLEPRPPAERYEFLIEKNPQIEWDYYKEREEGKLLFDYLPFHYPQIKLYTRDQSKAAYIFFQESDGNAALLGLRTPGDFIVRDLVSVAEYAESMGAVYLEMLISAHDPLMQKLAYEAGFLPCAYFPAARIDEDGKRVDYVITSCTFAPLRFKGLKMTSKIRPFLQAFHHIYSDRLWDDVQ